MYSHYVPIVSPRRSGFTEAFTKGYSQVCADLNVPLAENCPNHEKAFGPSTFGTVLGIGFDTTQLEWFVSKDKADDLQTCIDAFLEKKTSPLLVAQKLHGKMSSFAQMSDFLQGFRFHLSSFLRKFELGDQASKIIPQMLKDDLWIWKKVIESARLGLPLAESFEAPPLFPCTFVSDAAGAAFEWENGRCKNITNPGDRGEASVKYTNNRLDSISILRWPPHLLTREKSQGGGGVFWVQKWNPGNGGTAVAVRHIAQNP
jgi:hypothetical protein